MSIASKRNSHLTVIQIILSFLVMAALVFLTLGNLVSIPTAKNEKTEEYIDAFYSHYSNLEGDELGDRVELGALKLWGEALHAIIPTIDLLTQGQPHSELSAADVCDEEGFLLLTFLIKETFVTSIYESLAYLFLMLALMLLPFFIGLYFLYALGYMLLHLLKGRDIFLRVTHCLSKCLGGVFLLGLTVFFCPCSAVGSNLSYLLLLLLGIVLFWIFFAHIKERSRDRRHFLIYSQIFSFVSLAFGTLSLWFVHRAGLINTMYEKTSAIDGLEIFLDLWDGQLDSHLLLMFLVITLFTVCLAVGFFCIYHILTRLICIYNAREKKSHDRLFQYPIFLLIGLLSVILLLKASKHYALQLTPEAHTQYILAIVFAALALLCEILYSSIGHFVIRVDMVTRLEILSGYAENRLVMDEETLKNATAEEIPASEPAAEEIPASEPAAEEIPEGEPVAEEIPESEPAAEEIPEGEPAAEEIPEGEPVAEEIPEGEPVAEEIPEGKPVAEEIPESEPVAEEIPEGKPVVEEIPESEPAAEEIPESEIPTSKTNE